MLRFDRSIYVNLHVLLLPYYVRFVKSFVYAHDDIQPGKVGYLSSSLNAAILIHLSHPFARVYCGCCARLVHTTENLESVIVFLICHIGSEGNLLCTRRMGWG